MENICIFINIVRVNFDIYDKDKLIEKEFIFIVTYCDTKNIYYKNATDNYVYISLDTDSEYLIYPSLLDVASNNIINPGAVTTHYRDGKCIKGGRYYFILNDYAPTYANIYINIYVDSYILYSYSLSGTNGGRKQYTLDLSISK